MIERVPVVIQGRNGGANPGEILMFPVALAEQLFKSGRAEPYEAKPEKPPTKRDGRVTNQVRATVQK